MNILSRSRQAGKTLTMREMYERAKAVGDHAHYVSAYGRKVECSTGEHNRDD